ncbi:Uncharacterized membrane protein YkvA, DUF1232 family [Cohaesibacter sp. ES.047]|uniref:YkvA family protein n=1 Tax=Cohaesibacter sp. ES.047 TaxID=1798205 RepID=UPI000BB94382|nr:YkvA family protein [Cohaesibacter sp. ES.047]SNY90630.1 Uncharacterized membrane protein YkvA, DUF1232 family [Cohaesibacter sp. ES.047]
MATKHYTEDDFELLPPEKAAEDESGHRDKGTAKKAADVRRKFWTVVKKAARQIPIIEDVVAGYYCAFDANTPFRVRLTLIGALAYFVLPFDVIPDMIMGVGFTDDLALLAYVLKTVHANISDEHRLRAKQALSEHDIHVER